MMRKTLRNIFSLCLVLSLIIPNFARIYATDADQIEILRQNIAEKMLRLKN